ncbi:MAG: alpha/beta hydrolase [Opitutus sp.]|nr:alpha/beta hydrolase [Opitutus sp.]
MKTPPLSSLLLTFALVVMPRLVGAQTAGPDGVKFLADVKFLAADRAETLDLYLPPPLANGGLRPGMVWIHGGGWMRGEKAEGSAKEVCGTLANAGYVTVSANYRIGKDAWSRNVTDCKDAVRFLRAHAAEYGVDPDRIGIAGGSAGAHLALMVAMTAGRDEFEPLNAKPVYPGVSSAVRCVIDMYGPTNLGSREATDEMGKPLGKRRPPANSMEAFGMTASYDGGRTEFFLAASPVTYVNRNSPPVLILQGALDPEVDPGQPRILAAVLTQHGVPHELITVEGAGHGFDFENWKGKPMARDLRPVALAFLAKHLAPVAKR